MIVLGLHYGHNGGACVVKDGKLVSALSTERLSGNLKCWGTDRQTIDAALAIAGIGLRDVNAVALSDYTNEEFTNPGVIRVTDSNGQTVGRYWTTIFDNDVVRFDAWIDDLSIPAYHISHHLAHCAAAYYTSNFDESYCFSLDASGGKLKSNSVIAKGTGTKLEALSCPGLMVGVAYGFFTEWCNIGSQMLKAGTMMGLAPFGTIPPHVQDYMASDAVRAFISEDSLHHVWMKALWERIARVPENSFAGDSQVSMDIAASIQKIFELSIMLALEQIPAGVNLCLGGGSMLNCTANSIILNSGRFKAVHHFPACTDDGGPVGTALYIAHHVFNEPRHIYTVADTCYLGPERPKKGEADLHALARELGEGKVIAWVGGRAEFGPRALGNRSIFADPRSPTMCAHMNKVKNREWFRPFAPIVMEEHLHDWFEFPVDKSPFMLFTAKVKQADKVPAITHIDGTARVQTVTAESNPDVYNLINEFYKLTGVPMLLNTSMNQSGKAMVETPEQIELFWEGVPVDIMVIDGVRRDR